MNQQPIHIGRYLLEAEGLEKLYAKTEDGAIVTFSGNVRDSADGAPVEFLEFEAYEPMALNVLRKIKQDTLDTFGIRELCVHHRIGKVEVGEAAVVVVVFGKHRKEAFAACAHFMDRLKSEVPIWKKEVCTTGKTWVAAHA